MKETGGIQQVFLRREKASGARALRILPEAPPLGLSCRTGVAQPLVLSHCPAALCGRDQGVVWTLWGKGTGLARTRASDVLGFSPTFSTNQLWDPGHGIALSGSWFPSVKWDLCA